MRDERSIIRGHTTFCDDIRHEAGGKISLMGIYNSTLIPDSPLPTQLNRLCAVIAIRFYKDETPPRTLDVKVWVPGQDEPLFTSEVEVPQLPAPQLLPEQPQNMDGYWTLNLHAVFAPMPLMEEGYIRVRAYDGDVEWKLGALQIVRPMSVVWHSEPPRS